MFVSIFCTYYNKKYTKKRIGFLVYILFCCYVIFVTFMLFLCYSYRRLFVDIHTNTYINDNYNSI